MGVIIPNSRFHLLLGLISRFLGFITFNFPVCLEFLLDNFFLFLCFIFLLLKGNYGAVVGEKGNSLGHW